MTQFTDLGLAEPLLRALAQEGYLIPTPIQAQAIPAVLQNRDLLGIAQTGTGKTAAFALPTLDRLMRDKRRAAPKTVRALILAPTRELAVQIAESFRAYGRHCGMRVGLVIGGVSAGPQAQTLSRGLEILVATPGRLLDHVVSGAVRLNEVEVLTLDEADHMLDLGFLPDIRKLVSRLPKQRQSLFFSATMPREIAALAADMLRDPVEVKVTPVGATVERVRQEVILVDTSAKAATLVDVLKRPGMSRAIVFTRTKRGADRVAKHLEAAGVTSAAIHGNKSQNQRQRTLDDFKAGRTHALIATDIAARGIDVEGVTLVVNYDLPDVPEAYVHRIGRTARAGAEGLAISLCAPDERGLVRSIEKLTRQSLPVTGRASPSVTGSDTPAPDHRAGRFNPRPRSAAPQNRPQNAGAPGENRRPARPGPKARRRRYAGDSGAPAAQVQRPA